MRLEPDIEKFEEMQKHLKAHIGRMSGEDVRGIELISLMRVNSHMLHSAASCQTLQGELSAPRMGILLRLLAAEEQGNHTGLTPTLLSRSQSVKKNTMSSLLRGLEEDGYIERALDADDKRLFLIRITPKGKELIHSAAPARLKLMNDLTSGLSSAEKDQLIDLLGKLYRSVIENKKQLAADESETALSPNNASE